MLSSPPRCYRTLAEVMDRRAGGRAIKPAAATAQSLLTETPITTPFLRGREANALSTKPVMHSRSLLLGSLLAAFASFASSAQTIIAPANSTTTTTTTVPQLPEGFSINTTASTHYATQYLLNNTARPYHLLDPPYVSPTTGEVADGASTTVFVELTVNRIYGVEPKSSSFILDMSVNLFWIDPRLAFDNANFATTAALEIDPDLVWKPFIYFSKLAIDTANVPNPVFEDFYVLGDGSGTVQWTRQLVLPFSSKYSLRGFPYDNQTLSVSLFLGKGDSGRLALKVSDTQFTTDGFSSLWSLDAYTNTTNATGAGEATFSFSITRVPSSYITRYILPMALLCIFPPRFTGLIALMLAVVTLNVIVSQELPKVAYLTTMDAFIITTFLYVFFSLVSSTACYTLHSWKLTTEAAALQAFLRVAVPLTIPLTFGLVYALSKAGFSVGAWVCVAGLLLTVPAGVGSAFWEVSRTRQRQQQGGGGSK
ncbi:neurotransmitter-gated ion-channel ligand binding domain-containing protein [Zopfochytrium polystomum]|nr:neurotransmitter-gated ion-channel ligand binding domain-containing protein [Zopfochytrium polystomum]